MNERTYKDYNKPNGYYCKLCDKNIKDRSNWSKHIKTSKHLHNETKAELLEIKIQLEIMKRTGSASTVNNTTIVIDNSCNITNNIFVFNKPERKNLSDVLGDIDMDKCLFTDTRDGDKRFEPCLQIQKRVLNLIPSERPIIIKGNRVMCKNNNLEYIDEKAKAEIGSKLSRFFQQQVSLIDTPDFVDEMVIQGGLLKTPTDCVYDMLHKQKENLTYKQTDE